MTTTEIDLSKLLEEIEAGKSEFRTDRYSMSIGEVVSLYKEGELKINPEFQRYFRWSISQQTQFIESIILGIPIPPIFVYQDKENNWELVDGLQRIGTILGFMGFLKDERIPNKKYEPTRLSGTKRIPHLKGVMWDDLPKNLQLEIRKSRLNVEIIKHETDDNVKFELFQRLNSNNSPLSEQEKRNAIVVMANKPMYEWMERLSQNQDFQDTISISDRLLDERYDMELLLRYLVYSDKKYDGSSVGEFLTTNLLELVQDFGKNSEQFGIIANSFEKTFKILNIIKGENAFKKENRGKFLESLFEAISIGLGKNIDDYDIESPDDIALIQQKIDGIWKEEAFHKSMGSGTNASSRINKIIPFGIEYFKAKK